MRTKGFEHATFRHKEDATTAPGGHARDICAVANPGNIIECIVGGGVMGSPLCHENEAPFPEKLAEFFVRSFCPPGGIVADCFLGSGTTLHAAIEHGRRGIGCDLRQSQLELSQRRLRGVTPTIFAGTD